MITRRSSGNFLPFDIKFRNIGNTGTLLVSETNIISEANLITETGVKLTCSCTFDHFYTRFVIRSALSLSPGLSANFLSPRKVNIRAKLSLISSPFDVKLILKRCSKSLRPNNSNYFTRGISVGRGSDGKWFASSSRILVSYVFNLNMIDREHL